MTHTAILLLGHGARDPQWVRPFEAVRGRLEQILPGVPVATAYLELCAPTLAEAVAAIAATGIKKIAIAPLFFAAGVHLKRDLPSLIAQLETRYPDIAFEVSPAVGEADAILDAIAQWVAETLGQQERDL